MEATPPAQLIDARIEELGDWRGEMLARIRALIKEADPEVVEEWKWRGVPVWYHAGMICTGETYKKVVKVTFAKGASLDDPFGPLQFQPRGQYQACDRFPQDDEIDEEALQELIGAAVALNNLLGLKRGCHFPSYGGEKATTAVSQMQ
jgi:hypothetical protein